MAEKLFKGLEFSDDLMCKKCGRWYITETLVDDDGVCPNCKRAVKTAQDRAQLNAHALLNFWRQLQTNYTGDISENEFVYFFRGQTTRRIKIGYTSVDVYDRLIACQTGSPDILEVLGAVNAPYIFEQELHRFLAPYNSHGEWFDSNRALIDFIKKVAHIPLRPKLERRVFETVPSGNDALSIASKTVLQGSNIAAIDERHPKSPHTRFVIFPIRPAWVLNGTLAWLDSLLVS